MIRYQGKSKMQQQKILDNIIKDCFWDLDFTDKDLADIINSKDIKKKSFLFDKILLNSTNLFIDLKIFNSDDLKILIEKFEVPNFNYDYIFRRKNIVEVYFLDKPLLIDELKWVTQTIKNFTRSKIDGLLQIDFVNDIVARYKNVKVLDNNYIIDNVENILSNKLTAVIGRDNPKDIFDIYLISKFYTFSWEDILNSAHEKAGFNNEDLIIRLKSFPIHLLERINIIDTNFLNNFEDEFIKIIEDISKISG